MHPKKNILAESAVGPDTVTIAVNRVPDPVDLRTDPEPWRLYPDSDPDKMNLIPEF